MTPDIQTQLNLEELFNANQTLPRIREIFRDPTVVEHCEANDIPVDFAVDCLAQMVLHKRAKLSTLVGILRHHFQEDRDAIPTTEELQSCADMLMHMAACHLLTWDNLAGQMIMILDVTQDVYDDLDRYEHPLPMVIPPQRIQTNKDKGYYSRLSSRGSVILGRATNHHDDDVCLDHLNRVNQVPMTINTETMNMVQNKWRHLDQQKDGESREKYEKRVRAFEKFDRTAKDVLAHLYVAGNRFYLTHNYDTRGRCYARGYHVNPQGNGWSKAVVEFADPELVELDTQEHEQSNAA